MFVQTGLLSKTIIRNFKVLLSRRTDVDYGDFESIDVSDAEDSLRIASEMIEELDGVRKKMMGSL